MQEMTENELFHKKQEETMKILRKYEDIVMMPNLEIPNLVKQPQVDLLPYARIQSQETPYCSPDKAQQKAKIEERLQRLRKERGSVGHDAVLIRQKNHRLT